MSARLRISLMILTVLALGGCAGVNYVVHEYSGIEPKSFDVAGEDTYRVFDRPDVNKLMITPSLNKAMGAGALQGLTFGGVDAMDSIGPKPMFEHAALAYLASTGRQCRIIDGYLVVRPQWEFKYDCSIALASPR